MDPPQDQAAPIDEALAIPASARAGAAADGNATGIDDAASTASTAARTISASALVFRPAIAAAGLDLDRGIRRPSAFIGYEGPITEYYSVLTIDRQYSGAGPFGYGWGYGNAYLDRYERHAITEKVGILHR